MYGYHPGFLSSIIYASCINHLNHVEKLSHAEGEHVMICRLHPPARESPHSAALQRLLPCNSVLPMNHFLAIDHRENTFFLSLFSQRFHGVFSRLTFLQILKIQTRKKNQIIHFWSLSLTKTSQTTVPLESIQLTAMLSVLQQNHAALIDCRDQRF